MYEVALIACCGAKLPRTAMASELYQSVLFKKSMSYAKENASCWYILSALHGLVSPTQLITPYNVTLKDLTKYERMAWGCKVITSLAVLYDLDKTLFLLLAGLQYCNLLESRLRMDRPLRGLLIGKQLAWLEAHTGETLF